LVKITKPGLQAAKFNYQRAHHAGILLQLLKSKPKDMKQETINYEVLLFTNTSFSKRQFCEKGDTHTGNPGDSQLQNACWNGLVFEILPDIIKSAPNNPGYTWEVIAAENFIEVKIGAAPYSPQSSTSINPYWFLLAKNFN